MEFKAEDEAEFNFFIEFLQTGILHLVAIHTLEEHGRGASYIHGWFQGSTGSRFYRRFGIFLTIFPSPPPTQKILELVLLGDYYAKSFEFSVNFFELKKM